MSKNSLSKQEYTALKHIRNLLVHEGTTPSLRELMPILGYRSANSVMLVIRSLIIKGYLKRRVSDGRIQLARAIPEEEAHAKTVSVPLVGSVPCGRPMLAEENIETYLPVSEKLAKIPHRHFLLRAVGDSMNAKGIEDGDLVLVRQQHMAQAGQTVVALIDEEATIKEFYPSSEVVVLRPRSRNKDHKPIIVHSNFQIQGIVIATIPHVH